MAERDLTETQLRSSPGKLPNWMPSNPVTKDAVQHMAFSLWRIANALEKQNEIAEQAHALAIKTFNAPPKR